MKGLALLFWFSLVGSDPLVDPWEVAFPGLDEIELRTFYEPSAPESWSLDDNQLLNPFEQP